MITEIDRIYDLDVFQVWNRIKLEKDCPKKIKDAVKWGNLEPKIEIHELGNMRPKGKKGLYLYKGRVFTSEQIWEDTDKREIEGKNWLLENAGVEPLAKSR